MLRTLALVGFKADEAKQAGSEVEFGINMFHNTNERALFAILHHLFVAIQPQYEQVRAACRGARSRRLSHCER